MQTPFKCACGAQYNIESQGDLPVGIKLAERTTITVGGVEYALKNDKGESLKRVVEIDGKAVAEYWTPPPIPATPPPVASEPVATH